MFFELNAENKPLKQDIDNKALCGKRNDILY